jgi:NAD(P)-dependent dehydrogenase (short-subunit alcohol dehydrogenase family)
VGGRPPDPPAGVAGPVLAGRGAIVTGASQGLGRAIAASFVEAGASVLLVARGEALLETARVELAALAGRPGQRVEAMAADVSDAGACAAVAAHARARLPDLGILVNNAGIYGPIGRLEDVDWSAWVEAVRVNLFGTALMCRAVVPLFRARGGGKIVNLSGGGATSPLPRFSAYASAKAAVVRLTETLAEELRDARVDVNAIAPGALNTRLLDQVLLAGPEAAGEAFYRRALRQREEGGAPLARGAALAVFLASPASDGITGRLLSAVWDDWASLAGRAADLAGTDLYTLRRVTPPEAP